MKSLAQRNKEMVVWNQPELLLRDPPDEQQDEQTLSTTGSQTSPFWVSTRLTQQSILAIPKAAISLLPSPSR